jgi:uncharacterized protein (TIGR02246 family)
LCFKAVAGFVFLIFAGNSFGADKVSDAVLSRALTRVNLFSGLTDSERGSLKSVATLRHGKAEQRIVEPNAALDKMFIILDGDAEVRVNGEHMATLSGQPLIGETEFLGMHPAYAEVVIRKNADIIELDNAALTALMEKKPRIGYVLMREIARIEAQRLRNTSFIKSGFPGKDNPVIDKVRLDFNVAFNESNSQAIAELIDPDAIWLIPGEPVIVGQNNIVAQYSNYFTKVRSTLELKPGDIQMCGDWAYLNGGFSRSDTPVSGGAVQNVSGHYLFVLKKQADGAWKIARDIWNEQVKP